MMCFALPHNQATSVCAPAAAGVGAEYEQVFLPCTNATDYCGYQDSSSAEGDRHNTA